jgi:putative transport protein
MGAIIGLLQQSELLLLFAVILLGSLVARLQVAGVRIGVAGVLFTGMILAALLSRPGHQLTISAEVKEFGLVLFVYAVGLTSGPGFFRAFQAKGLKANLAVLMALLLGAGIAAVGAHFLHLDRGLRAGLFAGALTNTPALGAASDVLRGTALESGPVLAYSVTYPFGVLGALLLLRAFAGSRTEHTGNVQKEIVTACCEIQEPDALGKSIGELDIRRRLGVVVSRVSRAGETLVPTKYTVLQRGDVALIVGTRPDIEATITALGVRSQVQLAESRERVDMRRILVSRHDRAGQTLEALDLARRFNAQVTRLRRADVDLVPSMDFRIELGDRLRVVAPRERLKDIAKFFGDSERELAEVDFVGLALGLCLGLALARVPIPLFGLDISLGVAGGPLVVAILLGHRGRTGPVNWILPFEINSLLRELGLLLFLAGVGVGAGAHVHRIASREGLALCLLGALVTTVATLAVLFFARYWEKAPVIPTMGALSGMQTQPATLAAAFDLSAKSEDTYVAYSMVYPVAMIGKILLAQLLATGF